MPSFLNIRVPNMFFLKILSAPPVRVASAAHQVAVFALLWGISACTSTPRPELPVPVEISIAAAESLNPTEQGRPSPVLLRIYELSEQAFFQSADFFTLLGEQENARNSEVIEVHEFMLMPGEVRVLRRRTGLGTRFLGVAVAYRDLGSVWRAQTAVPAPRQAGRFQAGRFWSSDTSPQQRYRVVVGANNVAISHVPR